jgi:hypothetical protein
MSKKQEALILSLARQLDGGSYRFISQCEHLLPVSRSAARGLSTTDASLCIDHLQAEVDKAELAKQAAERGETAPTPEPTPEPEGGPTADQLLAMLGKKITVTWVNRDGETVTWDGTCRWVQASDKDGTPEINIMTARGMKAMRTHRLTSWVTHI